MNNHLYIVNLDAVSEVVVVVLQFVCDECEGCYNVSTLVLLHCLVGMSLVYVCVMPGLGLVITAFPIRRILDAVHP